MDRWRLILDDGCRPAHNMAVDEAILSAFVDGKSPPTLRLYGWEVPSISLGYFQNLERSRIDLEYCRNAGVELVRRPTGGRAVLHGHDVTFSVVADANSIPDGFEGVLGCHVWLMRGIVAGMRLLGIEAEIGPMDSTKSRAVSSADCFAHVAECDIRTERGKAAGAAQVRRSGALLEQGSIPHTLPEVDAARIFGASAAVSTGDSLVLREIPRDAVEEAMVAGFAESLGVSFERETLSEYEARLALDLESAKYASVEWTLNRRGNGIDNGLLGCYTNRASSIGGGCHA